MNNINNINGLPPFKRFCATIGNLPSSYVDSLSYYENLMWLCKYLKDTVIPTVNENAEAVNELINWFNNLDVQDEIDNKLDEMVKDGTLGTLIDSLFNDYKEDINNTINTFIDTYNERFETLSDNVNDSLNTQNTMISDLNAKITSSVSSTPIPVTSTDDMTNTSKIYLLISSGHWYYYDGDSWEDGGVYQATSIGDNTVKSESIVNNNFDKVFNTTDVKSVLVKDASIWDIGNKITYTSLQGGGVQLVKTSAQEGGFFFYANGSLYNKYNRILFKFDFEDYSFKSNPYLVHYNNNRIIGSIINGSSYLIYEKTASDTSSANPAIFSMIIPNEGSAVLKSITTYYFNNNLDIAADSNLSSFINNYKDELKYSDINNTLPNINYNTIRNWNFLSTDTNNYLQILDKRSIKLTSGNTVDNIGFKFGNLTRLNGNLIIQGNTTGSCYISIIDGTHIIQLGSVSAGDFKIEVNIDNLYMYSNLTSPYNVLISVGRNASIVVTDLKMGFNDLVQYADYDSNLEKVLYNLLNKTSSLESQIVNNSNILVSPNGTKFKLKVDNNGQLSTEELAYNKVLYIGNSLLLGFGTHGMASYDTTTDYYAKLNTLLSSRVDSYTSSRVGGVAIETGTDIDTVDSYIENSVIPNMSADTDLVIIQLGDNTANSEAAKELLPTSIDHLVTSLREVNSDVKIIWVGTWYNIGTMLPIINSIASTNNIQFIDISSLNVPNNCARVGDTYIDENGNEQTISNSAVASHPNNNGHQAIANLINSNI